MCKGAKQKKKGGFTLAELLIVVAIIGVLVAVSIPIFTAQLEKAREATDIANLRAAKAAAVVKYMTGEMDDERGSSSSVSYNYDTEAGLLFQVSPDYEEGYTSSNGQGTTVDPGTYNGMNEYGYNSAEDYTDDVILVQYTKGTGSDTLYVCFSDDLGSNGVRNLAGSDDQNSSNSGNRDNVAPGGSDAGFTEP